MTPNRKRQDPQRPVPKQFASREEVDRGIKKLTRRRDEVRTLIEQSVPYRDQRVENAANAISKSILDVFGPESPEFQRHQYFGFLNSFQMGEPNHITDHRFLHEGAPSALSMLDGLIDSLEESKDDLPPAPASSAVTYPQSSPRQEQGIFIGHGRSLEWMRLSEFLKESLHLDVQEYNSQEVAGLGRKERLQQLLEYSSFAFLVLTAEDHHADGTVHSRENVIHEVGLFQGRLGFERAIVLLEEGCAEFSNIDGLEQLRFPHGKIDALFERVRRVLQRERVVAGIFTEGQ